MNKPLPLNIPVKPAPLAEVAGIQAGRRYHLTLPVLTENAGQAIAANLDPQSGIVGAYRLDAHSAGSEPVDLSTQLVRCFVWDVDSLSPIVRSCLQGDSGAPAFFGHNRLNLHDAGLDGPEVRMQNGQPVLAIAPRFDLEWATGAFPSQLGWVQLVESSRTLQFEEGGSWVLLDTEAAGGPVLYLDDANDNRAVKPVCAFQQQGDSQRFNFITAVTQPIPSEFNKKAVASVSVLEKYTGYFMQNAAPDDPERHIWTPVHLPIVWGWSIRVQQRYDGVWDIFRKKLILPAASTEAPALPHWQSNSVLCGTTAGGCGAC